MGLFSGFAQACLVFLSSTPEAAAFSSLPVLIYPSRKHTISKGIVFNVESLMLCSLSRKLYTNQSNINKYIMKSGLRP
jgi:hypothetical protein